MYCYIGKWEVIRGYLLSIQHYLLELAGLSKALDDLVRDVSSEVHTKSKGGIRSLHQVSQLL